MSYMLIVIDMQEYFDASNDALTGCKTEIHKAINDNASIIFLEYEDCGSTLKSLTDIIHDNNYDKVYYATKSINDGSSCVLDLIRKKELSYTKVRVCGINTDYCVASTVEGLINKLPITSKIEVAIHACASEYSHEAGVEKLSNISSRVILD